MALALALSLKKKNEGRSKIHDGSTFHSVCFAGHGDSWKPRECYCCSERPFIRVLMIPKLYSHARFDLLSCSYVVNKLLAASWWLVVTILNCHDCQEAGWFIICVIQ
jgi:hypothetical protein